MAKPRVFISSTYFDLKHIRKNIELFVDQMGYEPVLFESGDIPFEDKVPLDISCYKEIENCHIQILIIGGRYGAAATDELFKGNKKEKNTESDKLFDFYNSITKKEYLKARELGIPVFIFVQKGVLAEFETYKKNRENVSINYAHVDSVNIFRLIDEIFNEKAASYVKDFENFDDIQVWLKEQWAGLFANQLSKRISEHQIKNLSSQVNELSVIVNSLKEYSEAIMRTVKPENYETIIAEQEDKLQQLTKFNELMEIEYIRHLASTHRLKLEDIFNALNSTDTFDRFKEEIFKLNGREFKCIDQNRAKRDINSARNLIEKPPYEVSISKKDFEDDLEELFKTLTLSERRNLSGNTLKFKDEILKESTNDNNNEKEKSSAQHGIAKSGATVKKSTKKK